MAGLIARRLAYGVLTLFVVSVMVFGATELLPGDVAQAVLGQNATPETLAAMRERLGLDRPATVRYADWLSRLVTGDLGESLATGRSVALLIDDRLWNTARLAGFTGLIAVPLSIALGLLSAMHAGGLIDRTISASTLSAVALPEFLLAAVLIFVFSISLGWLPATSLMRVNDSALQMATKLTLPVLTLTLIVMAHMVRMTRNTILGALTSPYVEMALLKGVPRYRVVLVHTFTNVLPPILNIVALVFAYLLAGVVIVEAVFSYPGLGRLMVDSVGARDLPVVQACAMIFCAAYVLLNLAADVAATLVNPRLRHPR